MFTFNRSDRFLARVVASLVIATTVMFGAIAHAVLATQPLV
jgi:hypothetical protein